jgi:predicted outer membrane repeat protein
MKKQFSILTICSGAVLGLLLLAACANPFIKPMSRNDGPAAGKGWVRIGTGAGEARTALPAAVFNHYDYLFSHEGGAEQAIAPVTEGGFEFELQSGNWTVTVNAYAGPGNDSLAATGEGSFVITLGEETGVTVKLIPVEGEGTGTLSYALTYPAGTTVLSFTLTLFAGDAPVDLLPDATAESESLTGSKIVNAGYYLAYAVLEKNGIRAGQREVAHIYKNMTTELSYAFREDNFKANLVFSSADSGPGSLREAIANTGPDGTIAVMLPEDNRVITLESTLAIDKNLVILGNGAVLTGNGFNGSLVTVSGSNVTLGRLHFRGGRTTGDGAAVSAAGSAANTVTLESCIFSDNQAGGNGGAIYVSTSALSVLGSTFYGNSAAGSGGAINSDTLYSHGNLFYGNTAASGSAYSGYASSTSLNASDATLLGTSSRQLNVLPISPLSFRPLGGLGAGGVEGIGSKPGTYPAVDFEGTTIPASNMAAGAIQTPATAGRYFLDYAAAGPGAVNVQDGALDKDGLVSGPVTLEAVETGGGGFRYWLVDGFPDTEKSASLTHTVIDHTTVRAVFYTEVGAAEDGVPGSLRDAIANASGRGVIIPAGISPILNEDLAITGNMVIEGKGATVNLNGHHIVVSGSATEVAISRVHFKGGMAANGFGGAIQNGGILTIESCVFSGNQISGPDARGGALYSTGAARVLGSTFYGNSADSGKGGAVWQDSETLTLQGNLFWGNTAAFYAVAGGTLTSQGFNIADKAIGVADTESGWALATGDDKAASLPLSSVSFKPFTGGGAVSVITAKPAGYPDLDFYGEEIPETDAAAGAAQVAITPAGHLLDYAAQGPGVVELDGSVDPDGFVNSSVTLRAYPTTNGAVAGIFRHWIVDDGAPRQESDNPYTFTPTANTIVRAVFGGTWTISSGANGGEGSFREVLVLLGDGDTVVLDGQTITLTEPLPATSKKFAIQGKGATLTQNVPGGGATRLLSLDSGAELTVSRVHFKGGRTTGDGGAVSGGAALTFESCIFSGNQGGSGGALWTSGSLTLLGCTFYGNSATVSGGAAYAGGAIDMAGNLFWGNTAATTYPVVYSAGGAVSGGGNISEPPIGTGATESGWASGTGDDQAASLPLDPGNFQPFTTGAAYQAISFTPGVYPDDDFYGESIPSADATSGAVQTATTPAGYSLDYAADGPGQVTVKTGSGSDGIYTGSVTLKAIEDPKDGSGYSGLFRYWTIGGQEQDPQTPANELTIYMNEAKTVRAVFVPALKVTAFGNDGPGTLRQVVSDAAAGDLISIAAGQTITLTATPTLVINKNLTIEGNGATLTQTGISAGQTTQLLCITSNSTVVRISRLHFTGGRASMNGAAINNGGKLTLESCIFSNNQMTGTSAHGGAIFTTGSSTSLTVLGCTFTGNAAGTSGNGGAIYRLIGTTVSLTGNIFSGNTANNSLVVFHASGATTGGYNVTDMASGYTNDATHTGWTIASTDKDSTTVNFSGAATGDFTPSASGLPVIPSLPAGFPKTYFDGTPRGSNSTPGAMPE